MIRDGVLYTPRKQGAGLAKIYNAIHTGAYLTVEGCERPKAELKDNINGTYSFTFTIHNISDSALSYDVSAVPLTAKAETLYGYRCVSEASRVLPESEFKVTFSQTSVTVPANGTVDITVDMQLTDEGKQQLAEFFKRHIPRRIYHSAIKKRGRNRSFPAIPWVLWRLVESSYF